MRCVRHTDRNYRSFLRKLDRRAGASPEVASTVAEIIAAIGEEGDAALLRFSEKFGGPKLSAGQLRVTEGEFAAAEASLGAAEKKAILAARRNVVAFAKRSLRKSWFGRNAQGAIVGERFDPFARVGIYVPGGTAPLVSTAIMTCTIARAAGVPEIVAVTPAGPDGSVHPALLAALKLSGATEVYRVGGAQAVAALACGTQTIRPVLKIFGPGNAYVVEAKRQTFGRVAIDLLPGPSEVLVIADASAKPDWIAADLLAQSEHGHGSISILLTDSAGLLDAVKSAVESQLVKRSRATHLRKALANAALVQVPDLDEAVRLANDFACEHVSIATRDPGDIAGRLTSAGAIFLGGISPVVGGDFLAGPSHELPTGGAGKSFAGLTADQFQRRTSIVRYDRDSLARSLPFIETFSRIEGLDAHGESAAIRLRR